MGTTTFRSRACAYRRDERIEALLQPRCCIVACSRSVPRTAQPAAPGGGGHTEPPTTPVNSEYGSPYDNCSTDVAACPPAAPRASMPRMRRYIARTLWTTVCCAAFVGAPQSSSAQALRLADIDLARSAQALRLADSTPARSAQARRPNVLLIMADDLNNDMGRTAIHWSDAQSRSLAARRCTI